MNSLVYVFIDTTCIRKIKLAARDLRSNKLLNFQYLPLIAHMVFDNDSLFLPGWRKKDEKVFSGRKTSLKIRTESKTHTEVDHQNKVELHR